MDSRDISVRYGEVRLSEQKSQPPALSLKTVKETFATWRAIVVEITLILAILLFAFISFNELRQSPVIFEPLKVPKWMAENGFSPEVAANELLDATRIVQSEASTSKLKRTLKHRMHVENFQVSSLGVSTGQVTRVIRKTFGLPETTISGEFVCLTSHCTHSDVFLRLRVRLDTRSKILTYKSTCQKQVNQKCDEGPGALLNQAAIGILEIIDPYVAAAHFAEADPDKAEEIAVSLQEPFTENTPWATLLLGYLSYKSNKDEVLVMGYYKQANKQYFDLHKTNFALAQYNLGHSNFRLYRTSRSPIRFLHEAAERFHEAAELDIQTEGLKDSWLSVLVEMTKNLKMRSLSVDQMEGECRILKSRFLSYKTHFYPKGWEGKLGDELGKLRSLCPRAAKVGFNTPNFWE